MRLELNRIHSRPQSLLVHSTLAAALALAFTVGRTGELFAASVAPPRNSCPELLSKEAIHDHKTIGTTAVELLRAIDAVMPENPLFGDIPVTERSNPNATAPELGSVVERAIRILGEDSGVLERTHADRAMDSLRIQTLTHLKHVAFSFQTLGENYPHSQVLPGKYPRRPTRIALERTREFLNALAYASPTTVPGSAPQPDLEQSLLARQQAYAKSIINDPFGSYTALRERLILEGVEASFPEFAAIVDYQKLKLLSDEQLLGLCRQNPSMDRFRQGVIQELDHVIADGHPYRRTLEAIQRATEYFDIHYRAIDPTRSPVLYHNGRYEYYTHFLIGETPDHIVMPTLSSLGSTDLIKARGVPISFVGVNVDIAWVDGYYQTPYEFWTHDINHSRRMWQFLKEDAARKGVSIVDYAERSTELLNTKLIPLIAIKKTDDEVSRNEKRIRKMLLFEILHEDALPAAVDVIQAAIFRPENQLTPFERIEAPGNLVSYIMEPGATTLAYTYRKLAHDFYDRPGQRIDAIVPESFRTQENVIQAGVTLLKELGLESGPAEEARLRHLALTDEGFPADFRSTLVRDINARPGETLPLSE